MSMKKTIVVLTVFLLLFFLLMPGLSLADVASKIIQATIRDMQLVINGQESIKISPILYEGRSYLPSVTSVKILAIKWIGTRTHPQYLLLPRLKRHLNRTSLDSGKWAPATLKRLQKLIVKTASRVQTMIP